MSGQGVAAGGDTRHGASYHASRFAGRFLKDSEGLTIASARQVNANRRNWAKRGLLTPEGRERLRQAALRNEPWRYSTGPRTREGKARARGNALVCGDRACTLEPYTSLARLRTCTNVYVLHGLLRLAAEALGAGDRVDRPMDVLEETMHRMADEGRFGVAVQVAILLAELPPRLWQAPLGASRSRTRRRRTN